jgi:hypothetical protein
MTISIHSLRDGSMPRDRAILDLLQLQELGLVPGTIRTRQLQQLWNVTQPQVSRRMTAIHQLGRYWVERGWGQYELCAARPITAAERWEAARRQLQEVVG